jgi:hypothetical protein
MQLTKMSLSVIFSAERVTDGAEGTGVSRVHPEETTDGSLCHIPLEDVILGHSRLTEGGHSSRTASPKGANDNHPGRTASLLRAVLDSSIDISNQSILVGVACNAREGLAVVQLPCPDLESKSCTSEASVVAKCLKSR